MAIDLTKIPKLVELLKSFAAPTSSVPLWSAGSGVKAPALSALVRENAVHLPIAYQSAFVEPLAREMGRVLISSDKPDEIELNVNTLVGALVQHNPQDPLHNCLRQ